MSKYYLKVQKTFLFQQIKVNPNYTNCIDFKEKYYSSYFPIPKGFLSLSLTIWSWTFWAVKLKMNNVSGSISKNCIKAGKTMSQLYVQVFPISSSLIPS